MHTDLAAWQAWVDYPVSLPQGSGALRLWLEVEKGLPVAATADVGLQDLRLKLAKDLPELDLLRLAGRISGERRNGDTRFSGKRVGLATRDGTSLEPTDFAFSWQEGGLSPTAAAAAPPPPPWTWAPWQPWPSTCPWGPKCASG